MAQPSTDTQRSGLPLSRDSEGSNTKAAPLQVVADALDRMRYGVIQMTVHDGKLVQLDITERKRFAS